MPKRKGDEPPDLSVKQTRALALLLQLDSPTDVAKKLGVQPATLSRWMAEPIFVGYLNDAKRQLLSAATTRLCSFACEAVDTLAKIMRDERAPHTARVSACRVILEHARSGVDLDDLAERVRVIEAHDKKNAEIARAQTAMQ